MTILIHQIEKEVERKRMELLDVSNLFGLHHSKTIQCSQELDKILNEVLNVKYDSKSLSKIGKTPNQIPTLIIN